VRRIAYLDLDAHHGDGVEDAFATDPDVLTISVHEAGRWPRTGLAHDVAKNVYNFPVPAGLNDTEFGFLLTRRLLPLIEDFAPEILLLLPGADALEDDSMSRLALSNNAIWDAVQGARKIVPRLGVFGGGGYNPYALARCWAGIWGILNDFAIPEILPAAAQDVLRGVKYHRNQARPVPAHWTETLRDVPRPGLVRDEIRELGLI
jgi:acetoin utilization protein AcuC